MILDVIKDIFHVHGGVVPGRAFFERLCRRVSRLPFMGDSPALSMPDDFEIIAKYDDTEIYVTIKDSGDRYNYHITGVSKKRNGKNSYFSLGVTDNQADAIRKVYGCIERMLNNRVGGSGFVHA